MCETKQPPRAEARRPDLEHENDHSTVGDVASRYRALREQGLPLMLEHVDHLERLLDQHPPDATVRLSLTDDVFLRSSTWARVQLGIPLPVED